MSDDISHLEHNDCERWYKGIKESLEPLFETLRSYLKIYDCSLNTPADTIDFIQAVFNCYTGTQITSKKTSFPSIKYNVVIAPDKKWLEIYNKLDYNKYRNKKLSKYYNALYSTSFTDQEKILILQHMKLINYQFLDRSTGLGKAWEYTIDGFEN